MTRKPGRARARMPRREAYTLKNLEQVKVLADALRIRILEAFCQERTTKQVAELLGEKATKLYHHVEALERVGLIALSRTQPNRGTVEKYYLAVARNFRANAFAFRPKKRGSRKKAPLQQTIANLLDMTSAELSELIDRGEDATTGIDEEVAVVSFLEIRGSKAQLTQIGDKLRALVADVTADGGVESEGQGRYRLTLAYYPLVDEV